MSESIFESKSLIVTRYAGPASEGPDRQRWKFTSLDGEGFEHGRYAVLDRMQVIRLARALCHDLGILVPHVPDE